MIPEEAPAADSRLVRVVGIWGLAASIVNITVGGGIFRLPAFVAGQLGSAAPIAYLVCAVAMGLIVLCFAEAGSRVALTGGPYAYVEVAFGSLAGFLSGVLLWAVGTLALAAVATLFADAVGALVPALGGPAARAAVLVATFALLSAVNVRGVRQGTAVNVVFTIAKLLPLLLLLVAGAFAVKAGNLAWHGAPSGGQVARTSVLLIFAFAGIETALVPSGEVRDVARTIPRAIALAMIGITLLYIGLHLVSQGLLGDALATSSTPLADAAAVALGPAGRAMMLAGAAVSMFGYVGGMTLAVPRALFALGRDGFLPRQLAAVHPRWHTPWVAIVVQGVIVCILAVTSGFEKLAILANLSTLLLYAGCCLAAWELRRRDVRAGGIPFRVPAAGVVPFLALAAIAYMVTSVKPLEWAVVAGVLAAAALIYFAARAARR
ncbi:APC family permease [Longimicrobium sp.]|uniref:APC family permease n=1 Tax=Longimicrobium sp. TaxID=2029185 RepID=UPI002BE0808E|nr:APC family permease [Longimicrobium sp.]HSU14459.1 APC family permease [Longimicrobium sp.]